MSARLPARAASPIWMLSLADLTTLLICFFLLLVSMSRLGEAEWRPVRDALQKSFTGIDSFRPGQAVPDAKTARDGDYWTALVAMRATLDPRLAGTQVRQRRGEIHIRVPSRASQASPGAVAALLSDLSAEVTVQADASTGVPAAFARGRALAQGFGAAIAVSGVYAAHHPGEDRIVVRARDGGGA